MLILNRLDQVQTVKIVHADGTPDSVTLQPRGGRAIRLPAGAELHPAMLSTYKDTLRTDPKIVVPAAPSEDVGE